MNEKFRPELYHPDVLRIRRSSKNGNYEPDWRHRQVEDYLGAINNTGLHSAYRMGNLQLEEDKDVIGYLNYRLKKADEGNKVCEWSSSTLTRNRRNGLGSLIKALVITKCTPDTIATLVRTAPENIENFVALYWDIAPAIDNKMFMSSLLFPFQGRDIDDGEAVREGLLFAAAWLDGLDGLKLLLAPHIGLTGAERKLVENQIQSVTTKERFIKGEAWKVGYVPPPTDSRRYIERLRCLCELRAPRRDVKREDAFRDATAAIGSGAPLCEFL